MIFENALETALARIALLRKEKNLRILFDDDICLWWKTAIIYILKEELEKHSIQLSFDMFHPYCDQQPNNTESLFLVRTVTTQSLGIFLESMLSSMTREVTPQLTELLNKNSSKCGYKDRRMVMKYEINHIVSLIDSDRLKGIYYALRHLSVAIAEMKSS